MKMTEEKVSKKEVNKKGKNIVNLKTLSLLLLIFAIAIIFIYPNTRNKIINAISGNLENVNEEETKLVGEDIYVSSAEFTSIVDGTESFDADDEPGNDSSPSNNVVRSFDRITYNVDLTMAIKPGQTSTEKGGKIVVEATLPSSLATLVKWDLEQMTWLDGTVSEDGTTLTGSYTLDENTSATSGRQNLQLVLQVYGAGNGTEIQPTFKFSLDGNNEEDKYILTPDIITVSAVGKYNIRLVSNAENLSNKVTLDFGDGNKEGRLYGYGFAIELHNDNKEKGLKGVEYPQGDITFDFDLKLERTRENSDELEDITNLCTPLLWNYKINSNDDYSAGLYPGRDMYFTGVSHTAYTNKIPVENKKREDLMDSSYNVYNAGNLEIIQEGNKLRVTVKDYSFNGVFPSMTFSNGEIVGENIGIFNVGYMQLFVPDNEESLIEDREYYFTVSDENMKIESLSNEIITEQQKNDDDKVKEKHLIKKEGTYNYNLYLQDIEKNDLYSYGVPGNAKTNIGKNYLLDIIITPSSTNDYLIKSENQFVKFDGEGIEPIYIDGEKLYDLDNEDKDKVKLWYVTKKDGTNWSSQEEMNNANIEEMDIYENIEDIPHDKICTGVYIESNVTIDSGFGYHMFLPLKVKDTAKIGKVYSMTFRTKLWIEELDRSIYTITNNVEWPEAEDDTGNLPYKKAEYSKDGSEFKTHSGTYYGASLLVVGANLHGDIKTLNDKAEYDLSRNENVVTYSVEPKLDKNENLEEQISNVTLKNMVTIPSGLEYIPGSSKRGEESYNEPEIIENEDGTTTLAWYIYGVTSGDEITPITFDARIDQSTPNETRLNVKYVVLEEIGENEEAKIGNSYIDFRTSETEVIVINLGSHKVYQEAVTPVIENNGEITYKITYQNKSSVDTPDFQVLDILPYNGDGRGTSFNGTYTLKNVKVTGDTSNLELFTTTKLEAREISPKDEGIGVSDIWENKEIGTDINEPATVIALKGTVGAGKSVEIEITLKTANNKGRDVYYNVATAQVTKEAEVITAANIEARVVARTISGSIWYDTNENGLKDEEEKLASGIEVELLKPDGTKAVDTNGNEIPNQLTNAEGKYTFINLPSDNYKVRIITDSKYKLTTANVGTNKEINSKFEEINGNKESYEITILQGKDSPELSEENVNAGLVVKDAKIIVHYLEEDSTPNDDSDNNKLLEDKEITGYKLGDSYSVNAENIENYITLRNSKNTSGIFEQETVEITYYYTFNKQDITVRKVWNDNGNIAGKRPTSIKVELKNGNNVLQEVVLSSSNANSSNLNIWEATLNNLDIYNVNGEKINYTVDEKENEGTLESYNKTINGFEITNTFTQNTEKINITVNKIWNDNGNFAGKRPEEITLILKREVKTGEEISYQEVERQTINGESYTFSGIAKYDEYNNEINYTVEEVTPEFYTSLVEKVENQEEKAENLEFKITNTFSVPDDKISIPVTKIWDDNENKAGKRPTSVTLELIGKNAEENIVEKREITLTSENDWKTTIENIPVYDEKADIIKYEITEKDLNNIFYTKENTNISGDVNSGFVVTNKFQVPNETMEIEVSKVWDDNGNIQNARPENVTLFLTGNSQEYDITLTNENKKQDDESVWQGKIGNLPKYDVNGNEITYTLDEKPIASEFYNKTNVDQENKTITNTFAIPKETVQITVNKIWDDNGNIAGKRPQSIELQLINKNTKEVVLSQTIQGNVTTNEGWNYTFEAPKYGDTIEEIEYEVIEKELNNEFYKKENSTVTGDMENGFTITNKFVVPNTTVDIKVRKEYVDKEEQKDKRPESVIIVLKNGEDEVERKTFNEENGLEQTFTAKKYDELGNEINYTVEELEANVGDFKFYTNSVTGDMKSGYVVTNTFTRPEEKIEITANKVWNDNDIQSVRRPESIDLVIKNNGIEAGRVTLTKDNLVNGTVNQWSGKIGNLYRYDENGNEITYTLEEEIDSNFYQAEKESVVVEDKQASITNNFVIPEDKVEVTVTKIWNDNNNMYGRRPESVYLTITGNGITNKIEVNENLNWQATFKNLPKYDSNGQEIEYIAGIEEVNEGDLKFYQQENTTGNMEEGYEIESGMTVPDEKISLTVNKVWKDNSIQSLRRPKVVTINVYNEENLLVGTYDLKISEGQESYTFEGLRKYDETTGKDIEYRVEEQEKNTGDLHFYTSSVGKVESIGENSKQVTITNTFTKPDDKTSVTVNKVWDDNNNEAGKRPESVKLLLKDGSETVGEQEVNSSNAVSGNKNSWQYTFTEIEKYDGNGQEKVYTVDEKEVNSGDLQFYNKQISGLSVTNVFTHNTENVNIPFTVKWIDNEIQETRRPESVKIILKANGNIVEGKEVILQGNTQENKDSWIGEFTDLPKYDELNNIINYEVEEQEVNSLDLKFYKNTVNGYEITNTFTRPEDLMTLTVTKIWEDQENVYGKRPEAVRVIVNSVNGSTSGVIEGKNNWKVKITGLAKYNENGQEITYTIKEEEISEGSLFFYQGTQSSVTKTSENTLNATITNKMVKTPGMVEVKYVDKYENKEISDSLEKEGVVGESFDISEDVKEIPGYTLIEEPEIKQGEYQKEKQVYTYYYAKNTEVTVKYLRKDNDEDNSNNEKLSEEEVISGYQGLEYNAEDKKKQILGYTLIETSGNINGTMEREGTEVIYYYAKNTEVTIKYLEKGNEQNVLEKEETIFGYEGKEYNVEDMKKEISGYTLVETKGETSGIMTEEEIIITYYYAKNTNVIVRYIEKDVKPEHKLVPDVVIKGYEGKEYDVKDMQKQLSGYTFVEVDGKTSGTMTKEDIIVTYYYLQNTSIRVEHIDKATNEILKTETITGKVGDIVNTSKKDISGYVLVEKPENETITMTKQEQVVKYYYSHISKGVIEKHIDEITGEVIEEKLHNGNEGDKYNIPWKEFTGYDLVKDKLPENSSGEMKKDEVIEVKYYYIKKAKVVISYVDGDTNKKIEKDEEIQGHENDNYNTEEKKKEIPKYVLVGDSGNTKGKMKVTVNKDGTFDIETKVTYYYKKQAGGVIVNHIDIATNKVIESEKIDGKVGDRYETNYKTIEDYDLVKEKLPENAQGEMTEEVITVNYYYEKQAKIIVKYLDKLTGEVLAEEEIVGHIGDEYKTEEKAFSGYDLVEKPSNGIGSMQDETTVVKYYYKQKATVEIKYIEKETGYEIEKKDTINGYVGDNYEIADKEIQYYNLIEKTQNYKGIMTKEKIVVNCYYERKVFNLGVDMWIGSVNVNGIKTPAQSINSKDELYKVDINRNKVETAEVKITYKIRVTNNGEIEGSVGKLTQIIPSGFSYYQEDNSIYWENNNGILTTNELKDEIINPGEYKEIEITLRWNRGETNFGQKDNMVIITEMKNPAGFQDKEKEDNSDKSSILIEVATGLDRNDRIVIIVIVQIVLAITIGLLLSYEKKSTAKVKSKRKYNK